MTRIETGYRPGAIGRITELHGRYYSEEWGFEQQFECEVARELAEFVARYDEASNGLWLARADDEVLGSIVIDGDRSETDSAGARLRWFILAPAAQGEGLGQQLMDRAMTFCQKIGFERVYLWTFDGLDAAKHLYEQHGFELVEEQPDDEWGPEVTHQQFEVLL